MDNTYCPYCLHRMDKDELTDEGLRDELARRLYPDAEELKQFPGFCSSVQQTGGMEQGKKDCHFRVEGGVALT